MSKLFCPDCRQWVKVDKPARVTMVRRVHCVSPMLSRADARKLVKLIEKLRVAMGVKVPPKQESPR